MLWKLVGHTRSPCYSGRPWPSAGVSSLIRYRRFHCSSESDRRDTMEWLKTAVEYFTLSSIDPICGTLSNRANQDLLPEIPRLNQSLYEFYKPADGCTPTVEVIFFHGLPLNDDGGSSRAYLDTWTSSDGSTVFYWPQKLLAEEFQGARILSVSYDSCPKKEPTQGTIDQYCNAENLLQDLVGTHTVDCPLVLVGKDIGGLTINSICLRAHRDVSDNRKAYKSFLNDIKGVLYYCTPHSGFKRLPKYATGALMKDLGPLNKDIARSREEFYELRRKKYRGWRMWGIGCSSSEKDFEVPEGSSRNYMDMYYTAAVETMHSICRPYCREQIAYSYLSDLIRSPEVQFSSATTYTSYLDFEMDHKYVPLQNTIDQIRKAFEKSKVVVLHGDSGTGKSSLARHFALAFEESVQCSPEFEASCSARSSPHSRPIVVFVSCGREANISTTQEYLLSIFGSNKEKGMVQGTLRNTLVQRMRDRGAFIVLDDVWEEDLVENILVTGDKLKYLITSRKRNLWPDSESILIEDVDILKSRNILAASANFARGILPKEFEGRADELIKAVDFHPLALATLGTILGQNKCDNDKWRNVTDGFFSYLKKGGKPATVFSKNYFNESHSRNYFNETHPRSVHSAMMLMMDYLNSRNEHGACNLLYAISLFKGPHIPESVVQLFVTCTQPARDSESFGPNINDLEDLNLIRRARKKKYHWVDGLRVDVDGSADDQEREGGRYRWVLHLHDLRRKFILGLKGNMINETSVRKLFDNGTKSNEDLSKALCAIYGIQSVQEEARKQIPHISPFPTPVSICDVSLSLLAVKFEILNAEVFHNLVPHMILEWKNFEKKAVTHLEMAATEVFWAYFAHRKIDADFATVLLKRPNSTGWICTFLQESLHELLVQSRYSVCVSMSNAAPENIDFFGSGCNLSTWSKTQLSNLLDTLVRLLDRNVKTRRSIQLKVIRIIVILMTGNSQVSDQIAEFPDLHKRVLKMVRQVSDPAVRKSFLFEALPLVICSASCRRERQFESWLKGFWSGISEGMEPILVKQLETRDLHEAVIDIILDPALDDAAFLEQDTDLALSEIIMGLALSTIRNEQLVSNSQLNLLFQRLGGLLVLDNRTGITYSLVGSALLWTVRAWGLGDDHQISTLKIQCRTLLENVVMRNPQFPSKVSMQALAELAQSPHTASIIVSIPGCLEKLVGLLDEQSDQDASRRMCSLLALTTVKALVATLSNEKSRSGNGSAIGNETLCMEDLLKRVSTSENAVDMCVLSIKIVAMLAPTLTSRIRNARGRRLVSATSVAPEDVLLCSLLVLTTVTDLLMRVSTSENAEDMSRALSTKIVAALLAQTVLTSRVRNARGRRFVSATSVAPEDVQIMEDFSGWLGRLVTLLDSSVPKLLQELSLHLISVLAACGGTEVLVMMLENETLVSRVVSFLSKDESSSCLTGLEIICKMVATNPPNTALPTRSYNDFNVYQHMQLLTTPGLLERFVTLISEGGGVVRETATRAFLDLCYGPATQGLASRDQDETLIQRLPHLLEGLAELLGPRQQVLDQSQPQFDIEAVVHRHRIQRTGAEPGDQDEFRAGLDAQISMRKTLPLEVDMMILSNFRQVRMFVILADSFVRNSINYETATSEFTARDFCPSLKQMIALLQGIGLQAVGNDPFFLQPAQRSLRDVLALRALPEILIQKLAAYRLGAIARLGFYDTHDSNLSLEVHRRILKAPNLLERLTTFLPNDAGEICGCASFVIATLAGTPEVANSLIATFPHVVESLFMLLEGDVTADNQYRATLALANLLARDKMDEQIRGRGLTLPPQTRALLHCIWSYGSAMRGDYSAALNDINAAISLNPGHLLVERGVLQRLMGKLPQALDDLNLALDMVPNNYEALKHRSLVNYMMKNETAAREDAEQAIQANLNRVQLKVFMRRLGTLPVQFPGYNLK